MPFDGALMMRARERQVVYLARYGRQSMLQWEDRPVRELDRWFGALKQLLDDEGAAGSIEESRDG